ncbi:HAD domain-containing protein [Tersicoccus sp. MR15.9]|uniref:HAD domain-containing protein n=1 Tax=Tersicoccus mangrovi TaxID=3121635 RepID=UPI002FE5F36B
MIAVYLDVDGVLSPLPAFLVPPESAWKGRWDREDIAGFRDVAFHPAMIGALNQAVTRPGVAPRWLTSWEEHAPGGFAPATGLAGRTWPVLDGVIGDAPGDWWKLRAIRADVAATAPDAVVWADDELARQEESTRWLASLDIPTLALSPNEALGLTPVHVAQLAAFIDENTDR